MSRRSLLALPFAALPIAALPIAAMVAALVPVTVPAAHAATTVTVASAPGSRDDKADARLLEALINQHIMPRVGALATTAATLPPAVTDFCAKPDAAGLDHVRQAYTKTMLAWAAAQHLKPGPLSLELRTERLAFWPDKRSVGTRQMAQVLAKQDPAVLAPGGMPRQSAALQGLPALERLLFDDGVTAASFAAATPGGAYRCQLAAAIADNIAMLTRQVADGWKALAPVLLAGQETTPGGKGPGEAINNLYLAVLTAVQVIEDQKLRIPLGATPADAKPALAESVRAHLSLKLIAENITALRDAVIGTAAAPGFAALLPAKVKDQETAKLAKAFDALAAAVAAVPEPLEASVADAAKRPKVDAALKAAKTLQGLITHDLPPLLGITVGFNELDGD